MTKTREKKILKEVNKREIHRIERYLTDAKKHKHKFIDINFVLDVGMRMTSDNQKQALSVGYTSDAIIKEIIKNFQSKDLLKEKLNNFVNASRIVPKQFIKLFSDFKPTIKRFAKSLKDDLLLLQMEVYE